MTWILAGATVMLLSAIAVGYRRADRDRCRSNHPTALRLAYPLAVAANGDTPAGAAPGLYRRARHLVIVPSHADDVSCRR